MSIRIPNSPVLDYSSTVATATTDSATCLLPQDTDAITVFVWAPTFGLTTSDVYVQTSPDGGTTWFDMGDVQVTAAIVFANSRIAMYSTTGATDRSNQLTNSVIGSAGASTVGANLFSGVPILGRNLRVYFKTTGTGASTVRVQVYVQNQTGQS